MNVMHPLEQLRSQLRGRVIEPGDPDYDQANTVFYGGEERHPAAIARVASAEDVARVVTFTVDQEYAAATIRKAYEILGGVIKSAIRSKRIAFNPAAEASLPPP